MTQTSAVGAACLGMMRQSEAEANLLPAFETFFAVVLASTEAKTVLLDGFYQALLGRNATPAELAALVPAVRTGMRDEQVLASIVGSAEYLALIP